jgi:hypothetical protein
MKETNVSVVRSIIQRRETREQRNEDSLDLQQALDDIPAKLGMGTLLNPLEVLINESNAAGTSTERQKAAVAAHEMLKPKDKKPVVIDPNRCSPSTDFSNPDSWQ